MSIGGRDVTGGAAASLTAFPTGVCDDTKPDPNRVSTVPRLDCSAGPGGEPLGNPPVSARA